MVSSGAVSGACHLHFVVDFRRSARHGPRDGTSPVHDPRDIAVVGGASVQPPARHSDLTHTDWLDESWGFGRRYCHGGQVAESWLFDLVWLDRRAGGVS